MAKGELTRKEKVILLGTVDGKRKDDFNEEFLNLMVETQPLKVEEVDDRIRRSICKFITMVENEEEISLLLSDDNPTTLVQGKVLTAWLHGYMVARRWNRSIKRAENTPPRKG